MAIAKKKNKMPSKTWQTKPFRMDWPYLLEEGTDQETGEPNGYRMTALCPPEFPIAELEDIIFEVYEAAFGKDEEDWPRGRNDRGPDDVIRDCKEKKGKPGYVPGWKFFSMSSRDMPGVIDANKDEVMSKREIYGGRWARATINVAAYDNKSKGVGIYMNNVQLLDHDEALSGRPNAKDEFDEYQLKDKSGGKRRSRDDDEDEKPRSRRSRDDDEDEKPRSRRSRDDDDRDDEKPRSRSRGRDDEEEGGRGSRDRDEGRRRSRDEDDEPKRSRRNEDDDDDKPRSRSRSRDDDDRDDDRPRGRGSRDEDSRSASRSDRDRDDRGRRSRDDDDERPRSRKRDDEDEDERPSRRSSSRGRDDGWN